MSSSPEVWLRGPVPEVPALLQPVAHALLQAREEAGELAPALDTRVLWTRRGAASAGFHLLHLAGSLDRLFTYARNEALNDEQKAAARAEAEDHPELDGHALAARVADAVDRAMAQLRATDPASLTNVCRVGRTASSTVIGALFHGAEHTTRHMGQFISTAKIVSAG